MSWEVVELTPETYLIQNGHVIIGSMSRSGDRWLIEILWSGPSGDIKGDYASHSHALAFIEGAKKTMFAMRDLR